MNAYLIEAHRPSATWEKQTRLVSGRDCSFVAFHVESLGLVIDSIKALDFTFNMRVHNPRLLDPWVLDSKPAICPGADIPETSPLYRK